MAAEAAVSIAVETLGSLLREKISALRGVEGQVSWLQRELERMQCFLRHASERQASSVEVRKWISDVRGVAHDAEDAVETYDLTVDAPRKSRGLLRRSAHFPVRLYHLNKLGQEIEAIKRRLEEIDQSRERYGIPGHNDDTDVDATKTGYMDVERQCRVSPWKPDDKVVGFEEHVSTLLNMIFTKEEGGLSVSSIVGMGGAGKSTLAMNVYNHEALGEAGFEQRAWVTVSREFNRRELMKDLLKQLLDPEEDQLKQLQIMEYLSEDELKQTVYHRLERQRYFVVVDDVWRQEDWNCIQNAFPDNPANAGRVLITSRFQYIPTCAKYVHKLEGLDDEKSWELFLKVGLIDTNNGRCPLELEDIGKQVLKKCNGLPLAITVMGSLLSKQRQTARGWQNVLNGTKSLLEEGNDSVGAVLELSYQDLPPNLKSCFLCLSFFKEDVEINPFRLMEVWISEGYVPEKDGQTMEETANNYLNELINRNMVRAIELFDDGQVQFCGIHDLLRDLAIEKAKEEINFGIFRESSSSESSNKARHLSVYTSLERFMLSTSPNLHLRSLFLHHAHFGDHIVSSYWRRNKRLRVLELEGVGLTKMPETIARLIGLKYLNLCGNYIQELPRSLGELRSLQTLIIERNANIKVPNVIWKLENLRHLFVSDDILCMEPLRLNTLRKLQTLTFISAKSIVVEHLAELVSLRLLVVGLTMDVDVSKFFALLAGLQNLAILGLEWSHGNISIDGVDDLQHLTELEIDGPLKELPSKFPQNISSISLRNTHLSHDPVPRLQSLPMLLFLGLYVDSYIGEEMVIARNGFLTLKILCLSRLYCLRRMCIGYEALPKLKQLKIESCPDLEIIPKDEELRIMRNLEELKILDASRFTKAKFKGKSTGM